MQQGVPVRYFVCSLEAAQADTQKQRPCDQWILDWPAVDRDWLFGDAHLEANPLPAHSPLARHYYEKVLAELAQTTSESLNQCENRRRAQPSNPIPGVRIQVSSQLPATPVQQATRDPKTRFSQLSIRFAPDNDPPGPKSCPDLPRELFEEPVQFDFVLYGPGGGNFHWQWQENAHQLPEPMFEFYARPLKFTGQFQARDLGTLNLVMDRVADLWVRFNSRPKPISVTGRLDPDKPLNYQITTGKGYLNVALVLELEHLASGQSGFITLGGSEGPGQLPAAGEWPSEWDAMSPDAEGIIRHHQANFTYVLRTINPADLGLPAFGDFRLRVLLLAYGYDTQARFAMSTALGTEGDTRMSWKPIFVTQMPSLTSYIPGTTEGLINPFHWLYTPTLILTQAIGFEVIFDLKNLTTFRFVVKLTSQLDFPVGLIIQAAGWQTWITLGAGQTRYLSGATSVSGMGNWNAYPLHPFSPLYGWHHNWGNEFIRMDDAECRVSFRLYLTAPLQPDCIPPELPTLQAGLRWRASPSDLEMRFIPRWSAIKRFSSSGQYEFDAQNTDEPITELTPVTLMPAYAIIDPTQYFAQGYDTAPYDNSPWHKRPWTLADNIPVRCQGEKQVLAGFGMVWAAADDIELWLTREHLDFIATSLGVTESVLMDGDDLRWFQTGPEGIWHNRLWINRFYTLEGGTVDETAMRHAFDAMLNEYTDSWPHYYRNLRVHDAVRFGTFLDNGAAEAGQYALNETGNFQETDSMNVNSVSTRFLYRIYSNI